MSLKVSKIMSHKGFISSPQHMDLNKPVQRSSPFWIGVTDVSRGTLSTTVWHKPRTAFPSLSSSASPVIA